MDLKDREQKKIQITLDKLEKEVKSKEHDIYEHTKLIAQKQLNLDKLNKE